MQNPPFFNPDVLVGHDAILITEGITDAIKACEAAIPAISPVTVRFSERYMDDIADRLRGKTVIICNDNEENGAGASGMRAIQRGLYARGIVPQCVILPRREEQRKVDVCSYILEYGADAFHALIAQQTGVKFTDSCNTP